MLVGSSPFLASRQPWLISTTEDYPAISPTLITTPDPPYNRRIFVNRDLDMNDIEAIGFDMDYTLAIYNQEKLEILSIQSALDKMINLYNYSEEVKNLIYDHTFAIRGLLIDPQRGNILKIDKHGAIERCFHGQRWICDIQRDLSQRLSLGRQFAWVDTLFSLPEVCLFSRLVEFFDDQAQQGLIASNALPELYEKLWHDIRTCIDQAHRDNTIKNQIVANLPAYIYRDPNLALVLHRLRSVGKKLFLVTNSDWEYTQKVMHFLLDQQLPNYPTWQHYFDLIVVDAQKPTFFTKNLPLVEIENPHHRKIFQQGNVVDFQQILGIRGENILYVGDHIYGDMLRAKKSSVWRTAMILQELEHELDLLTSMKDKLQILERMDRQRIRMEAELHYQHMQRYKLAKSTNDIDAKHINRRIQILRKGLFTALQKSLKIDEEIRQYFHPIWGMLFKSGAENSRFGEQVKDYACVYTSRVSNFLAYSPFQTFRAPREHLPHERVY